MVNAVNIGTYLWTGEIHDLRQVEASLIELRDKM